MGAAVAIASKDLRRRIRDRTAILLGIVLPFGLAAIFSLTLGDVDEGAFSATYAFVDRDHGELAVAFEQTLGHLDFATLRRVDDAAAADRLAQDGEVDAAFVVPEGFSASVTSGGGGALEVVASAESQIGTLVAVSVARSFASGLDAVRVSIAAVQPPGEPVDPAAGGELAARAREVPPAAVVREAATADRVFSAPTFFAIGMAVFFLFFTVEFGVRGLLEEREEGTLARLLVAPVRPASVLSGKGLASFAVGLVSTSLLVIASSWLLGADWGNPVGVAALVLTGVFTAVAVTALVTTLARTPGQAGSYASIVAVVGGLLGGRSSRSRKRRERSQPCGSSRRRDGSWMDSRSSRRGPGLPRCSPRSPARS